MPSHHRGGYPKKLSEAVRKQMLALNEHGGTPQEVRLEEGSDRVTYRFGSRLHRHTVLGSIREKEHKYTELYFEERRVEPIDRSQDLLARNEAIDPSVLSLYTDLDLETVWSYAVVAEKNKRRLKPGLTRELTASIYGTSRPGDDPEEIIDVLAMGESFIGDELHHTMLPSHKEEKWLGYSEGQLDTERLVRGFRALGVEEPVHLLPFLKITDVNY